MTKTTFPTAADIMRTDIVTVSRSAQLTEVATLLGEHQIGGVPVTDEAGHIVGIISLKDIVAHYAEDPDAAPGRLSTSRIDSDEDTYAFSIPEDAEETVDDVMTAQVHEVDQATPLPKLARKMVDLGIHRILVIDGGKRHVGLITSFDVLRAVAEMK